MLVFNLTIWILQKWKEYKVKEAETGTAFVVSVVELQSKGSQFESHKLPSQ